MDLEMLGIAALEASLANELPFGQVEYHLGFHRVQILGYGYICHLLHLLSAR